MVTNAWDATLLDLHGRIARGELQISSTSPFISVIVKEIKDIVNDPNNLNMTSTVINTSKSTAITKFLGGMGNGGSRGGLGSFLQGQMPTCPPWRKNIARMMDLSAAFVRQRIDKIAIEPSSNSEAQRQVYRDFNRKLSDIVERMMLYRIINGIE